METVRATDLKNRLGRVLAKASLGPVAIERHGKVVAYLTPAGHGTPAQARSRGESEGRSRVETEGRSRIERQGRSRVERTGRRPSLDRVQEERLVELSAGCDYRPSRWARAGDPWLLAGLAVVLASQPEFDRYRMLALAERLHPGMSKVEQFSRWLEQSPLRADRFLPMVRVALRRQRR